MTGGGLVAMNPDPPRITDPSGAPVIGTDAHLPAVPVHRLAPQALRRVFAGGAEFAPEIPGDGHVFAGRASAAASVLVPLVDRPQGLQVLLTRRTAHLRDHAGQISFPGGRADPGDADAVATALREAHEEVGLEARHAEVIGRLPRYTTVTHFEVTPILAIVSPDLVLRPDPDEVAEAFEVPLDFLMTPAHHRRHVVDLGGRRRSFLSMPWRPETGVASTEYFIWGATAAMLRNLYRVLIDSSHA
jgi:8-oxo-dGTP pyrophosphatase MutT (NUDIX family)